MLTLCVVGIRRFSNKFKPSRGQRHSLQGLPTGTSPLQISNQRMDSNSCCIDENLFPDELKRVLRGEGEPTIKRPRRKYNLDDFLKIENDDDDDEDDDQRDDEEQLEQPKRVNPIRDDDDDELEQGAQDDDEDLEEDDYGIITSQRK